MKRHHIYIITSIISIALIGLVGLQIYWINNAIKVKESQFWHDVNMAMRKVITKLEKIETAELYNKQMQIYNYLNQFPDQSHQSNKNTSNSFYFSNNYFKNSISGKSKEELRFGYTQSKDGEIIEQHDTSIVYDNSKKLYSANTIENNKNLNSSYQQKAKILNDIFNDMLNMEKRMHIETRVKPKIVDSLVHFELKQAGIKTKYEFGLYDNMRNSLVYQKSGMYSKQLLKESVSYLMFPDDMFSSNAYLLLYFPNKKEFLLTQMWLMLLISVILILAIIFAFVFIINIILRQKKISEIKNDFINNMTHEFKTPISTISLACEVLNDPEIPKTGDFYQNYIAIIHKENKRLAVMSEKILQSAVMERDAFTIKNDLIDLRSILESVINTFSLQIEKKQGQLIRDFKINEAIMVGDKVHIANVFSNLIDNAIKYTIEKPVIKVSLENGGSYYTASISDNGIGISKAHQKKIFEKLYRVPTGNIHNVKGYGLGLSYVKRIVEKHNGIIELESEPNKGTLVKIKLPLKTN